jgi:hypothetical protein
MKKIKKIDDDKLDLEAPSSEPKDNMDSPEKVANVSENRVTVVAEPDDLEQA